MDLRVVALAGGVGGAKLADGLAGCLDPEKLSIIVNTADDFIHLGLQISPDIDTVTYTLAGLADPDRGWGRADETWAFMETLDRLGGPTWFRLGDHDLALHHLRTDWRAQGQSLSAITQEIKDRFGVKPEILPMTDDPVQTIVATDEGELPFQEYFVARRCEPVVQGFHFKGIDSAVAAPGVLERLEAADVIVFCPSNPWVSLDPILAVEGVRDRVEHKPVVMVSPIIAGKTVKGPAAKMYEELGIEPSALAVARHYEILLDGIMIDKLDAILEEDIKTLGIRVRLEQTLMKTSEERIRVASALLEFASSSVIKEPLQ
jgi:LPPG:FO 2-phospho-L-lactate transferase